MPEISIIVPVYNVEQYLPAALDSLRAQTCPDWEAILVDDGSPDGCGALCDAAARQDARFRVIHQKNAGVGAARNLPDRAQAAAQVRAAGYDIRQETLRLQQLYTGLIAERSAAHA